MYHKLALRAADACVSHEWISVEQRAWCAYAIEKRINTLSMLVFLMLIAIPSGKVIESVAFLGSVTALRRRLGGWHAKATWSCQLISIASVLLAVFVIGPGMERQALGFIILFDFVTFIGCLIVKPIYPPQLHFTDDVVRANNRKKYRILCLIAVIQILSFIFWNQTILVYSALGMLAAFAALIAERCSQQRRKEHEEH